MVKTEKAKEFLKSFLVHFLAALLRLKAKVKSKMRWLLRKRVWLRLTYYETALRTLDEDRQEIFIDNFYRSVRQVNYITMITVFLVVLTYVSGFYFRLISLPEGVVIELLLVLTLFYMVWYYRMAMEDLLRFLVEESSVPDYARD